MYHIYKFETTTIQKFQNIWKSTCFDFYSQCYPDMLELGDIVVGNCVKRTIHIQNESNCGLYYDLFVDKERIGVIADEHEIQDSLGKTFQFMKILV